MKETKTLKKLIKKLIENKNDISKIEKIIRQLNLEISRFGGVMLVFYGEQAAPQYVVDRQNWNNWNICTYPHENNEIKSKMLKKQDKQFLDLFARITTIIKKELIEKKTKEMLGKTDFCQTGKIYLTKFI